MKYSFCSTLILFQVQSHSLCFNFQDIFLSTLLTKLAIICMANVSKPPKNCTLHTWYVDTTMKCIIFGLVHFESFIFYFGPNCAVISKKGQPHLFVDFTDFSLVSSYFLVSGQNSDRTIFSLSAIHLNVINIHRRLR